MLFQTVFLPSNFLPVSQDLLYQELLCDKIIGIFKDFIENCIILVDEEGNTERNWDKAIQSLPQSLKDDMFRLRSTLSDKKRIIKVRDINRHTSQCGEFCRDCFDIASTHTEAYIFATEFCLSCINDSSNFNVVNIAEYERTESWQRKRKSHYFLKHSEWDKEEFEEKILIPIFEHASRVDLYDLNIGDTIVQKDGSTSPSLPDNYSRTLEWMLSIFHKKPYPAIEDREISIHTGEDREISIHTGLKSANLQFLEDVETILRTFKDKMAEKGLPLKRVTINDKNVRMPHDRFIKTDQITLQIGRGFDLLYFDQHTKEFRIRDVTVTCCSDFESFFKPSKRVRRRRCS